VLQEVKIMSILFINSSPNPHGNTAKVAATLLEGKEYETLNLAEYKIYGYGQQFPDDQFLRSSIKSGRQRPSSSGRLSTGIT
jgi:hypothetical protein